MNKLKQFLVGDTAFKIYSVLIAVLLWIFVVFDQNPTITERYRSVSVYYTNAAALEAAGYMVVSPASPTVNITVSGRRLSVSKIKRENISASITIPEFKEGTYDAAVNIILPATDVAVTNKSPNTVKLVIEKIVTVNLDVVIEDAAKTKPKNIDTVLDAERVTVSGPASLIRTLDRAVVNMDSASVTSSGQRALPVKIYDKENNDVTNDPYLRLNQTTIPVTHSVYNIKTLGIEAEFTGDPADDYAISSATISPPQIVLGTLDKSIETIDKIFTEEIDLSEIDSDETIEVPLVIPEDVYNPDGIDQVMVEIKIDKMEHKDIVLESVSLVNAANTYKYSITSLPVTIEVSGTPNRLKDFDLRAEVDVSDYGVGEHSIPITVITGDGIKAIGEYTVDVSIAE